MKKLSLKNLKLDSNNLIQRNQMKKIFASDGGYLGCTHIGQFCVVGGGLYNCCGGMTCYSDHGPGSVFGSCWF